MDMSGRNKKYGFIQRALTIGALAAGFAASGNALAWTAAEDPSSPSVMSLGSITGNVLSFEGESLVSSSNGVDDTFTDSMTINIVADAGELLRSITINESAFVYFGEAAAYSFSAQATAHVAGGAIVNLGSFEWDSESTGTPGYAFALGSLDLLPGVSAVTLYLENTVSYANFDEAATGAFVRLDAVTMSVDTAPVPVPAALWLFAPGVVLLARRRNNTL
jgi:hypothetical protein